jgi:hypothetical protein
MIKILVTEVTGQGLTSLIESGTDEIKCGRSYHLEDATSGTGAQNRFFHMLVSELETSGLHSFNGEVRDHVKLKLGEGFESYLFWDGQRLVKVDKIDDVPSDVRVDRNRCFGKLKSWSDYTLAQRKKCIKRLIQYMIDAGVNSKRFDEICKEFYDG